MPKGNLRPARGVEEESTLRDEGGAAVELDDMNHDDNVRADDPLMRSSHGRSYNEPQDGREDGSRSSSGSTREGFQSHETTTPTRFVWQLVLTAGLSGLLFGYDTGVISSTLISIHTGLSSRPLTTLDKSLITSSTSLSALIASPITGHLADTLGRKRVIFAASVLFILGALAQALASTVTAMVVGRAIIGLGVGSASFVAPLYIGELSPGRFRGRMVTVSSLFVTGGQVVAYVVGWLFSSMEGGWRWMVGLGAVPAAVQLLLLVAMPETPRWLVMAGREEEAAAVLEEVYGKRGDIQQVVLEQIIKEQHDEERVKGKRSIREGSTSEAGSLHRTNSTFAELFSNGPNRRALTIACMLQGAQQLCGFNCLMYFSATIFAMSGFTSPTLTSLTVATTNLLFTFVAFRSIDRVGRRRILLYSIPLMILGLLLCALAFAHIDFSGPPTYISRTQETASEATPGANSTFWSLTLLLSLTLYVATYALGLGTVPWQQSELFPLSVRALGSSLATATNWGSNTLVGLTFLPMMEVLTPKWTFACYAAVCAGAWGAVWWCYPETAGLGLEEVGGLLMDGWGVRESLRKWEERKAGRRADGREHGDDNP